MLYSGILYINSKISPKNVRYKRSTKVARARKVVERSLLSSKGPEAPVLHEGRARARARARAKYPGHFRPAKKRPHQWIFEFFLRDWLELDEILPIIATKTKNSKKICEKKFVSKSPFQGLEPLPQILNKLGRNKKLNPSSRNAKGKAWFLCKIVGTAYFQTRKWPLCYRLIPDTTTPPGSSGPSTPKQKRYFSGLILHLHGTQSCILNKKRTKYNLEKQRSSPNWPVIMTPSRSSRRY